MSSNNTTNNLKRSIHPRVLMQGRLSTAARIVVAAIVAFVASSAWYIAFGSVIMALRGVESNDMNEMTVPAWLMLCEFARNLVVATVLAHLVVALHIANMWRAARVAALLWFGFPAMILLGSVLWENVPWRLAAVHGGDWLIKLFLITVILSIPLRRNTVRGEKQPVTT